MCDYSLLQKEMQESILFTLHTKWNWMIVFCYGAGIHQQHLFHQRASEAPVYVSNGTYFPFSLYVT